MAKFFNRAKMTTATTGAGTITLGSASIGFQSFADAGVSDGDVVQYVIEEGSNFEIGTGTYTATGTTLTRSPTESSNSGSAISLTGVATVSVTAIDDDYNRLQHEGSDKVVATSTGATVTGTLAATAFTGDGSALTGIEGVPSGVIAMWSGTNASIPSGWVLCDGNNSTPNLTDRFILGRAAATNTNSTGGANTVTLAEGNLPSHSHGVGNLTAAAGGDHSHNFNANTGNSGNHSHSGSTSNTGSHTHGIKHHAKTDRDGVGNGLTSSFLSGGSEAFYNSFCGSAGSHSHNFSTNGGGDHSHNFNANTGNSGNHSHSVSGNTGSTGSGTAVTITPIYYTLAFIMKT